RSGLRRGVILQGRKQPAAEAGAHMVDGELPGRASVLRESLWNVRVIELLHEIAARGCQRGVISVRRRSMQDEKEQIVEYDPAHLHQPSSFVLEHMSFLRVTAHPTAGA